MAFYYFVTCIIFQLEISDHLVQIPNKTRQDQTKSNWYYMAGEAILGRNKGDLSEVTVGLHCGPIRMNNMKQMQKHFIKRIL